MATKIDAAAIHDTDEHPAARQPTVTCSDWIANALADAGASIVFGGHGGALVPMVNAVSNNKRLKWVVARSEGNASLMAAAHGKLTGKLAVCIATSGPGATNLTTGLFDAMQDQVPVIAITGLKPRSGMHYSEFQDFNQSQMWSAGGLQYSVDVASPAAVAPLLRDAVAKAITMRTCVHLAIPVDVQAAPSPLPLRQFCAADSRHGLVFPDVRQSVINSVAEELLGIIASGRPRVIIGVGHRCAKAGPEILKLAERIHAPVLTRLDAKGSIDESHPLSMGVIGVHGKAGMEVAAELIQTAHLVLSFGNHDDTLLICNLAGIQIRPVIHFEPDAAASLANMRYRALHHVIGDPAWACNALVKKLHELDFPGSPVGEIPHTQTGEFNLNLIENEAKLDGQSSPSNQVKEHAEQLWQWIMEGNWKRLSKEQVCSRYEVINGANYRGCHPAVVLRDLSHRMDAADVLCVDVGEVTLWAALCTYLKKGERTLSSERMGTMGYGLCAGIASMLEGKGRGRSVVVAGDGGFQMTCNELGTLRQHLARPENKDCSLVVILFDNEELGRVLNGFDTALGCELGPSPDFVAMAKAYGGDGALLNTPKDVHEVMDSAFASKGLFVVHVLVDPLIKADMANIKDNSIEMMASG
eukprot:TRINITY_DN7004_c0_g1_i2.p1 TRINITY_DN7004_c0_g1~~TRINITY_DN7004_c0_g1_i2.p1  ORF type:complete len:641 (-),score=116.34 TRINITY_DN7004_c0_g1_i2:140-2062(-)